MIAPNDTLRPDTVLLGQLLQDPSYSYTFEEEKPSLVRGLFQKLAHALNHVGFDMSQGKAVLCVVGALVAGCLLWWLWRSGWLQSFFRLSTRFLPAEQEEPPLNIYHTDFEGEIAQAVRAGNYTLSTRLTYLQTLRLLSDAGQVVWEPQKTPMQYAMEVSHPAFKSMTHLFLRVRYGGFEADEVLWREMVQWQQQLEKGGGLSS